MVEITAHNLTKQYDDVVAVDGIDFEILDKELLVLVGPSGCGKSTTLRLIAGLEDISDGELYFDDTLMNDVSAENRNVSMVFQNYALFPHMSARRNMTFGMKSREDIDTETVEKRVEEAALMLGIEELLERRPGELSGGEKQRVAIGRAIVRDPDVFLLDEPLSNLDAKLKTQMRAELSTVHDDIEATTVYVTHDQTEAMSLGDRVAVLNNGTIQQVGEPQTIYDYPVNRFVAEFIGNPAMNILDVTIEENDGEFSANHEEFSLSLPVNDDLRSFGTGKAQLGIRPEAILLDEDNDSNDTIQIPVKVVEPLGDELLISGELNRKPIQINIDEPHRDISKGDVLTTTVDSNRLHLFDRDTEVSVYHSSREIEASKETDGTVRTVN